MTIIGSRLCLFVAGVTFAGLALAEAPSLPSSTTAPVDSNAPAQSLTEKLNQSKGVIHPKEVDRAIEKPVPKVGDPNVVPPPGTSGGASAPQPK
jgi:hypothetical protein